MSPHEIAQSLKWPATDQTEGVQFLKPRTDRTTHANQYWRTLPHAQACTFRRTVRAYSHNSRRTENVIRWNSDPCPESKGLSVCSLLCLDSQAHYIERYRTVNVGNEKYLTLLGAYQDHGVLCYARQPMCYLKTIKQGTHSDALPLPQFVLATERIDQKWGESIGE